MRPLLELVFKYIDDESTRLHRRIAYKHIRLFMRLVDAGVFVFR
jgi:hypothetical protein